MAHGLSCSAACGLLPDQEPMSPALAGGFLTTVPPGKSPVWTFELASVPLYQAWESHPAEWCCSGTHAAETLPHLSTFISLPHFLSLPLPLPCFFSVHVFLSHSDSSYACNTATSRCFPFLSPPLPPTRHVNFIEKKPNLLLVY